MNAPPKQPIEDFLVLPSTTILQTVECINRNNSAIALVTDPDRRLLGTITDGDIRRGVLAGINLQAPVQVLLDQRSRTSPCSKPITATVTTPAHELLRIMTEHTVHQVPLLDETGRVVDVALMDRLLKESEQLPVRAVVMAGGFGTRLAPLTDTVPKPMLPVGEKPILELIVKQLRHSGIRQVQFTTHYLPEVIREHFRKGEEFGLTIDYVQEDQPLGTAGALGLVETGDEPILVMNGDILTRVDFRAMLRFHREQNADLTVGVRQYDLRVPYGVVNCEGARVRSIEEKPLVNFLVNAGIYLLEPSAHRSIPQDRRFDMTDLIQLLTKEGRTVVAFPIVEYWLDVGQHIDYAKAQEDIKKWGFIP